MTPQVIFAGEGISGTERPRRNEGFTLVELLVVIGIIGLLISILLPALNKARDQANTVKCLSNLRTLGQLHAMYISENHGYLVPCDYRVGSNTTEAWATILVCGGYIPYPQTTLGVVPPQANVLRCPSAQEISIDNAVLPTTVPDKRTSGDGAQEIAYISTTLQPNRVVYSSYGINGGTGPDLGIPIRRWTIGGGGTTWPKISNVKGSSELVFMFDGISINLQNQNANRLNARHNTLRQTNLLFFDGHAATYQTVELPGGIGDAGSNSAAAKATFAQTTLTKNYPPPAPAWRLDQ